MTPSWWNRLFKTKSRPAARRRPARARLGLEALESRDLMSVSAGVVNGQLLVTAAAGDTITVDLSQNRTDTIISGTGLNATFFFDPLLLGGLVGAGAFILLLTSFVLRLRGVPDE